MCVCFIVLWHLCQQLSDMYFNAPSTSLQRFWKVCTTNHCLMTAKMQACSYSRNPWSMPVGTSKVQFRRRHALVGSLIFNFIFIIYPLVN